VILIVSEHILDCFVPRKDGAVVFARRKPKQSRIDYLSVSIVQRAKRRLSVGNKYKYDGVV